MRSPAGSPGNAGGQAPRRARRFLVVGGGCWGVRHAGLVARALERGRLGKAEIRVVDRDPRCAASALPADPARRLAIADWDEFFAGYLARWAEGAGAREEDLVVHSPSAPHLFARWLARALSGEAAVEETIPPLLPDTPLARLAGPGLALSFAEWRCPTGCIEPALCPATRQPRTWEILRSLVSYARRLRAAGLAPLIGPLGGRATHLTGGVAVVPLADWAHAARRVREALREGSGRGGVYALAATVSGCHGVATLVRVAPRPARDPG